MKAWLLTVVICIWGFNGNAESHKADPPKCEASICDLCFSPQQGCDQKLISYLDSARTSLDVAIYSLTLSDIGAAIRRAQQRGVKIRIIADYKSSFMKSSLVSELKSAGVPIKLWSGENNRDGLMHHKFAIIDRRILQTGSFNYSRNATSRNAENQIYMSERLIINQFAGEFERLWGQLH